MSRCFLLPQANATSGVSEIRTHSLNQGLTQPPFAILEKLKSSEGAMSITGGIVGFADGQTFDANAESPVVVTYISGGCLTNLMANIPVRHISADYDVDGIDEEGISKDPEGCRCIINDDPIQPKPQDVQAFIEVANA